MSSISLGVSGDSSRSALLVSRSILEASFQKWLSEIIEEDVDDLYRSIRSGVYLCTLINVVAPGTIQRILMQSTPESDVENISSYLRACRTLGLVSKQFMFEPSDLLHKVDLGRVLKNLTQLALIIDRLPTFQGLSYGEVLQEMIDKADTTLFKRGKSTVIENGEESFVVFEDVSGVAGDWGAWISWDSSPILPEISYSASGAPVVNPAPAGSTSLLFRCVQPHTSVSLIKSELPFASNVTLIDRPAVSTAEILPSSLADGLKLFFIDKSGWMYKMGAVRKNWKCRWFTLIEGTILYYPDKTGQKLLGKVELKQAWSVQRVALPKFPFCIEVVTNKRTYLLAPDSQAEQSSWMRHCTAYVETDPALFLETHG